MSLEDLRNLDTPLIVYVGEGLRTAAGLSSLGDLREPLLEACRGYGSDTQELAELDLGEFFSEAERILTPAGFGRVVERQLDDGAADVPPLGRALGKLHASIRGVVTPNLDHLVERAFEGRLAVHGQPVPDLASRRGWILKLHGTLRDRATWVLTREQQGRALYRDAVHQEVFRSLFMAHPVLFVGASLDDPVLAAILAKIEALAAGQPPRHWALVESATPVKRRKLAGAGVELIESAAQQWPAILESLATGGPMPTPAPSPAPAPAAAKKTSGKRSILFIAANPAGTDPLRLDRELRIIREAIERSQGRDTLELEFRPAATIHDVRRALLEREYDVIHVSGHGEQEGLILEDERGDAVQIPRAALARLFGRYDLGCVVLNACWTLKTGEATSLGVPFTVAMDGPISDVGAVEFSRGFYDALGAGRDYAEAYAEGRSCVELAAAGARFDAVLLRG